MGITFALLIFSGTEPESIERLIRKVKGSAMKSILFLISSM